MPARINKDGWKKLVKFPEAPRKGNGNKSKGKDFTRFQISDRLYPPDYDLDDPKIKWSKTQFNVGGRKMKSLIKDNLVDSSYFPHYTLKNNKVYYNTAFTKSYGLKQFAELSKLNAEPDDTISFQVSFYLPKEDAKKSVKFKDNPYNDRYLITRGGIQMVPLFHTKYFISCPYKTIYDFLQKYCKTNKTFFKANEENAYQAFWDDIINKVDIDGINANQNIRKETINSVRDHLIINFSNFVKNRHNVQPLKYLNGVARDDLWFNNKERITNEKKKGICKFDSNDEFSTYPRNGCLFVELYFYFYEVMDRLAKQELKRGRQSKYQDFCISRIYKIIYGKDAIVPSPNDGDAWGLTFEQVKKFLKYFKICGGVFDGFYGDLQCFYDPTEDRYTKNIKLPDFYYIYANSHAWTLNKKLLRSLSHKEIRNAKSNLEKDLEEIGHKINHDVKKNYESVYVNFDFLKKKNKKQLEDIYVFFDSFQEIFNYMNSSLKEGNYIILTNLDLKDDLFIPFLDHKIIPSPYIKYNRIDNLYFQLWEGDKNILIKNQYSASAGQTYLRNIEEYKIYDFYYKKIKDSLISPQYLSVYSHQVRNIFHTYKTGGLRCLFDMNSYEQPISIQEDEEVVLEDNPVGVSDFNRFFLSQFLKIKYFGVLTADDHFLDYDGSLIEDYTLYVIEKTNDDFQYPFYKVNLCHGLFLKQVPKERYIIKKMLRYNRLVENVFVDDFKKIYDDKRLSDSFKKDIPNIIFGFFLQKFQSNHKSYFSTDLQEIRHFQNKIGGSSFSLENEKGHFFYKKFSSPLKDGFYPMGLMLMDAVHFRMDQLKNDLESCSLYPFAINVDCIYHEINIEKYDLFKAKFPHYFDYEDKNDWNAVGKLKYEENIVHFYKEYVPKMFNFDFSLPSINDIQLEHEEEWDKGDNFTDEVASLIQTHDRLFFFGHAGMGKSTSAIFGCLKLGLKFLILTKTTKLSDKWIFEKYDAQTADSFFGFRNLELLPDSSINKIAFENADVIIFDDMLLYELKLIHQIFFMMENYPNKKYIGNADPLQLNKVLNTLNVFDGNKYKKLVGLCSRLFHNVIHLKINKRLKTQEDRNEFYKMVELFKQKDVIAIDQWIHKHFNIVKRSQLSSLRGKIKNVITATNPQRNTYNNFIFSSVHGNDDWFSLGHVIMFDKPSMKAFEYKFGKSQLFKIVEIKGESYTLENTYTGEFVYVDNEDWLRKNFTYPFATTCHSWQGDTCKENILIVGWTKSWIDLEWKFSSITRPDDFKKVYILIDDEHHKIENDLFLKEKLDSLIEQDIARFGKDMITFSRLIDLEWMKYKLHEALMEKKVCPGCDGFLNSWDRIDSSLPHYKSNTQLVCWDCNRSKSNRW
jgi:hypothetical protein